MAEEEQELVNIRPDRKDERGDLLVSNSPILLTIKTKFRRYNKQKNLINYAYILKRKKQQSNVYVF